jgi:hypothetical protein
VGQLRGLVGNGGISIMLFGPPSKNFTKDSKFQKSKSVLYDYYNPEARAEVEPTKFVVQ